MKSYSVELWFTGYQTFEIEAENEEQAREEAMNDFDMSFAELNNITEVKVDEVCDD